MLLRMGWIGIGVELKTNDNSINIACLVYESIPLSLIIETYIIVVIFFLD